MFRTQRSSITIAKKRAHAYIYRTAIYIFNLCSFHLFTMYLQHQCTWLKSFSFFFCKNTDANCLETTIAARNTIRIHLYTYKFTGFIPCICPNYFLNCVFYAISKSISLVYIFKIISHEQIKKIMRRQQHNNYIIRRTRLI